jgi:hypothetical protein
MSLDIPVETLRIDEGATSAKQLNPLETDPTSSTEGFPEMFDSEEDKLNWKTLCNIIDTSSVEINALGVIIEDLAYLSERFNYIESSIEWLRSQVLALRKTPPLVSDRSDSASGNLSASESESSFDGRSETSDDLENSSVSPSGGASDSRFERSSQERSDDSGSDSGSDDDSASLVSEKIFQFSETYDWAKIKDEVKLVRDIFLMAALMAIYEIFDSGCVSEADLDELFSQAVLLKWGGDTKETLLEVLNFLSQHFKIRFHIRKKPSDKIEVLRIKEEAIEKPGTSEDQRRYLGTKLDSSCHEIRVLELLPGSTKDPIRCSFNIVSLDDIPVYEALSYA